MAIEFFGFHEKSGLHDFMLDLSQPEGVIVELGGAGGRPLSKKKMRSRGLSYLNIDKSSDAGGEHVLQLDIEELTGFNDERIKELVGTDKIGAIIVSHAAEYLSAEAMRVVCDGMLEIAKDGVPCFLISGHPDAVPESASAFEYARERADDRGVNFQEFGIRAFPKPGGMQSIKLGTLMRGMREVVSGGSANAIFRQSLEAFDLRIRPWREIEELGGEMGMMAEHIALISDQPVEIPFQDPPRELSYAEQLKRPIGKGGRHTPPKKRRKKGKRKR